MNPVLRKILPWLAIGLLLLSGCGQAEPTLPPPAPTGETTAPARPAATMAPTPTAQPVMFRGNAAHSGVYETAGGPAEWVFEANAEIFSSAAIHDGVVYVGALDGTFYALERETGTVQWTFEAALPIGSSPAVAGDTVYVGSGIDLDNPASGGVLYALDLQTGDLRWQFDAGGIVMSSPAVSAGRVYVTSGSGTIYGLDAQTGEVDWQFPTQAPVIASPTLAGGRLYAGSIDGTLYGLDMESGEAVWQYRAGAPIASSAAIVDGTAYVGTMDGRVLAVSLETARLRWLFKAGNEVDSSPAVADGLVYIGSFDNHLYALDTASGKEKWRFDAESPIVSSPAVLDGVVYFGNYTGRVFAVDGQTGEEKWHLQAGKDIQSSPSVAAGTVYVSSFDYKLYAVNATGPQIALVARPTPRPPQPTPTPLPDVAQPAARGSGGLPWWNDRVFYEVFVRSFSDSDGDGIGDLQGLISKLDYLNDGDPATDTDLGVTGLWLMPIAESPSYHGYDTIDYKTIEQDYGTNDDFKQFLAEAHRRGMVVIVDLVMNHTSNQHPWFQDALTPGSEHESWYIWADEPADYASPWGSPVWHFGNGRYYYGLFWEGMPDLNYENGAVTLAMRDIIEFWLDDVGVDGFRLDAVRHLIEDGPVQANTPDTHLWLKDFFRYVRSLSPEALTVGEAWDKTPEMVKYVGDEVDVVFEFDLAQAILDGLWREDGHGLASVQATILDSYPRGQYAAFLTNHDQNRVMNQLRDDVDAARTAATLLLTNPGVPFIYYGEEIGMRGAKPDERIRTPMQWAGDAGAGFTIGTPWEAPQADVDLVNVAAQDGDPSSLLSHYRALIGLHQAHTALRSGEMQLLETGSRQVYGYIRHGEGETILVVVNLSATPVSDYALTLAAGPLSSTPGAEVLLGDGQPAAPATNAAGGFDAYVPVPELPARASLILKLE